MPTAITLLVLPFKMLSFFATKEVRFGAAEAHHPKVGCSGESAIYQKSCDPRAPESTVDRFRFKVGCASPLLKRVPAVRSAFVG
jgi:hypothetical protein